MPVGQSESLPTDASQDDAGIYPSAASQFTPPAGAPLPTQWPHALDFTFLDLREMVSPARDPWKLGQWVGS